jgi:hypothetical protein
MLFPESTEAMVNIFKHVSQSTDFAPLLQSLAAEEKWAKLANLHPISLSEKYKDH